MKRFIYFLFVSVLVLVLVGCGGQKETADEGGTGDSGDSQVKIVITNGKGEISEQFNEAAKTFMVAYPDIEVEVHSKAVGDTLNPYDKLTASGVTVTIAMFEPYEAMTKYKDIALDLSDEKWNEETSDALTDEEGRVIGFPFAIEGMGLVYNEDVVKNAVGDDFDPFAINTRDRLIELLDKIKESGIEHPVAYQTEAWSVGNHYSSLFLNQEGDPAAMLDKLANGSIKLIENEVWNGYYDTLDLLISEEYNAYGERPLGQYYDSAHVAVGNGESAILFNGNWAFDSLQALEGTNFGFMPVPVDNNPDNPLNNKIAVGPTQVLFINKNATPEEQEAAKTFLNWLVYEEAGQDFLVNKAQIISAFKNNPYTVTNPLGVAISEAIANGQTMPFSTNYINAGEWSTIVGPEVQKYIAGEITREDLAAFFEDYFKNQ